MKTDNYKVHNAKKALEKLKEISQKKDENKEEKIDVEKLAKTLFHRKVEEERAVDATE